MTERESLAMRELSETEVEIRELRTKLQQENRLDTHARHELNNALTLVCAFRNLLTEPAEEDLLADTFEAVHRARDLTRGVLLAA
jgi:hypothetical protein